MSPSKGLGKDTVSTLAWNFHFTVARDPSKVKIINVGECTN
jgi:hypothetical protein